MKPAFLKRVWEVLLLATFLALCGCKGDDTRASTSAPPMALRVANTSYQNAKGLNIGPQILPYPATNATARAFGDFFQRGSFDLFVATTTFDPAKPPLEAAKGAFEFWRRQPDNTFVRDTVLLASNVGCTFPTKAIVADFNHDGKPDVFIACRGLGATAFVGEKSAVLLSQPDGGYKTTFLRLEGAFVSAAAADLTGTGRIDVVAIDANTTTFSKTTGMFADGFPIDTTTTAFILVNDGQGGFTPDPTLLGSFITDFTDVEALDLNGDGRPDIVLLGADGGIGQPSVILLNDGTGSFANLRPTMLPRASLGNPAAQDVVFIDHALYLSRTEGCERGKRVVQRIAWPNLKSTVVYTGETPSSLSHTGWMVPVTRDGKTQLISDGMSDPAGLVLR
ncbi:FG-GAP repeat domain-containing protein [Caballeronia telluris]|uniref:FG-GAP repeat protein n=1 Tax=Caballeronia telluris TaxID=326475 RepID=A0A158KDT1_9BURK|nr:VCBS repeat-containing protein [Caballeronia telluris]SAL78601.1 FG-GAP repeat protein [Caballeronia telluris]